MSFIRSSFLGLVGAGALCWGLEYYAPELSKEFLAIFLALTASVYFGSGLSDGRWSVLTLETLVSVAVFIMALGGLWGSGVWLAMGYGVHGLWDLGHRPHLIGAKVAHTWFPPTCWAFDWVVGLYIFLTF